MIGGLERLRSVDLRLWPRLQLRVHSRSDSFLVLPFRSCCFLITCAHVHQSSVINTDVIGDIFAFSFIHMSDMTFEGKNIVSLGPFLSVCDVERTKWRS